jgi:hypothetical protein
MAEFATDRLVEKIDLKSTYINAITGQSVSMAAIPMHFPTDREIIEIALESVGLVEAEKTRILWIKNTLDLGEVEASVAYLEAAGQREDLEMLSKPRPLVPGADGNLPLFADYGQDSRKAQSVAAD